MKTYNHEEVLNKFEGKVVLYEVSKTDLETKKEVVVSPLVITGLNMSEYRGATSIKEAAKIALESEYVGTCRDEALEKVKDSLTNRGDEFPHLGDILEKIKVIDDALNALVFKPNKYYMYVPTNAKGKHHMIHTLDFVETVAHGRALLAEDEIGEFVIRTNMENTMNYKETTREEYMKNFSTEV